MVRLRESFEDRPQGRASHPCQDRVLAFEEVEVMRLPGRDVEAAAAELVNVPLRITNAGGRQVTESILPPRA